MLLSFVSMKAFGFGLGRRRRGMNTREMGRDFRRSLAFSLRNSFGELSLDEPESLDEPSLDERELLGLPWRLPDLVGEALGEALGELFREEPLGDDGATHCFGGCSCSIGTTIEWRRQALSGDAYEGGPIWTGNEIELDLRRSRVPGLSEPSPDTPARW
jgi:hypothetical protein